MNRGPRDRFAALVEVLAPLERPGTVRLVPAADGSVVPCRTVADDVFPRRFLLLVCGGAVGSVLPFLLPNELTGIAGVTGAIALWLSAFFWSVHGLGTSMGCDGRSVTARTVRGMRTVDLDRLRVVDGRTLNNASGHQDSLVLRDDRGGYLEIMGEPGFPPGSGTASGTLHVVHQEVRRRVEADRVQWVSRRACSVLGLPPAFSSRKVPPVREVNVLAVVLLLSVIPLVLGYVELVRRVIL